MGFNKFIDKITNMKSNNGDPPVNVNVIYLPTWHWRAQELVKTCTCMKIELEFGVLVLWREENRRTRRKTLGAGTRTNNKLNPHMAPGRNRTRATLVGGEFSHHCATPFTLRVGCQDLTLWDCPRTNLMQSTCRDHMINLANGCLPFIICININ